MPRCLFHRITFATGILLLLIATSAHPQPAPDEPRREPPPPFGGPPPEEPGDGGRPFRGPGGRGFPGGGPGGPNREERKLVAKFDLDKNGWLNSDERATARKETPPEPPRRGPGGRGFPDGPPDEAGGPAEPRRPRFGRRQNMEPAKPGERVSPHDVAKHPNADLYDRSVLRTLFLDFENSDWEKELSDFHNSDVEVPATLTVDGKQYPNVGIHFRGQSSYMMVSAGYKRSLNLSLDFIDKTQRLYGYRTLNLLNGHEDDSLMSTVLYSDVARQYLPAPKANFVRVVINGEDWGVYANVEQFNKDFIKENFNTDQGNRWKVRGNPGADGGLRYLGEEVAPYRERFTIKSRDDAKAWQDLIALCRTLDQTPPEQLEAALEPLLDIDSTLRFLALDVALVNNDGYWVRSSDYSLYQDPQGRFHVIPSDMNEAFHGGGGPPGGPGMRGRRRFGREADGGGRPPRERNRENERRRPDREERRDGPPVEDRESDDGPFGFGPPPGPPGFGPPGSGPPPGPPGFGPPGFGPPGGRGGVELDPLVGLENERTPLRSKLLAVPSLRARYLAYVRQIADKSLDWNTLGPVVADYRALIADEVNRETRKLTTYEAFLRATDDTRAGDESNPREMSLRTFAEKRRQYLLRQTDPANVGDRPASKTSRAAGDEPGQRARGGENVDPSAR